ncbi:MAG: DUF6340 family protein [Flavobacteriales bacterium]|nr:DUF6340 family protein [Flavobacteriales bacterium]MCX7649588.1 DUF6340 family protein [Flavobacteriales bacterium]MDW8431704.1 DUF6340 family protein [Flavobacteriales bacterium]
MTVFKVLRLTRLGLWIFLLWGCSMVKVKMEILRPASVTFPQAVQRVAVVDLAPYASENFIYSYENGKASTRFRELRTISAEQAVKALAAELAQFGRFQLAVVLPGGAMGLNTEEKKLSFLRQLAQDSGFHAIIYLDNLEGQIESNSSMGSITQYDPFGYPYLVPTFTGSRIITVRQNWRIRLYPQDVELENFIQEKKISYQRNGYSPDEAYKSLPSRKGSFENTAQAAAVQYARRLMPYWEEIRRKIYTGYTKPWLDACDSAQVGNWKAATEAWLHLSKCCAPFRFQKKQLYYNLSVGYELLEDFDNALRTAQNGLRNFGRSKFAERISILQSRIEDNELLDRQFGQKP